MFDATDSPWEQVRWLKVRNTTDAEAPSFAILEWTGADTDGVIDVRRPTTASQTKCLVNGPLPIPAGALGFAAADGPQWALWDTAEDTPPAVGEQWGTDANSWALVSGETGFVIGGGADEEKGTVMATWPVCPPTEELTPEEGGPTECDEVLFGSSDADEDTPWNVAMTLTLHWFEIVDEQGAWNVLHAGIPTVTYVENMVSGDAVFHQNTDIDIQGRPLTANSNPYELTIDETVFPSNYDGISPVPAISDVNCDGYLFGVSASTLSTSFRFVSPSVSMQIIP